jgi:hypothetical protein
VAGVETAQRGIAQALSAYEPSDLDDAQRKTIFARVDSLLEELRAFRRAIANDLRIGIEESDRA